MPEQSEPFVERRKNRRREEDVVVDHAVKDAPLVHRLLQTGKVAAAVGAIAVMVGGVAGAVGTRIVGPADDVTALRADLAQAEAEIHNRIDTTQLSLSLVRRRQDSLIAIMTDVRAELRLSNYGQCVMMRRFAPELRPPGCDGAERLRNGQGPSQP